MGLFKFLKDKFSKNNGKNEKSELYQKGLTKSRKNFASKLSKLSSSYSKVNEEYFEQLEQILIEADVGVNFALQIIEEVLNDSKKNNISDPQQINEILVDKMFLDYASKVLAACDTFRAGAIEQLSQWANKLNIPIVVGKANSDPASVAYDGARKAKENNVDLLIVDTAGRLQNKSNLMDELAKIRRVLAKEIENAPHETFLIIDATTGQNGVMQAKAFKEVAPITGIVITKMDGTSKGGIILAIRNELSIPVRFIGLGEKMSDLQEFDLDSYLYGLCVEDE